jgi:hypothetical protein
MVYKHEMTNKYLVEIDYFCSEVKGSSKWAIVEQHLPPALGVINSQPFKDGPLPGHQCKQYYYRQSCDSEGSCNWQEVLQVLLFTEENAKKLNAKTLETYISEKGEIIKQLTEGLKN